LENTEQNENKNENESDNECFPSTTTSSLCNSENEVEPPPTKRVKNEDRSELKKDRAPSLTLKDGEKKSSSFTQEATEFSSQQQETTLCSSLIHNASTEDKEVGTFVKHTPLISSKILKKLQTLKRDENRHKMFAVRVALDDTREVHVYVHLHTYIHTYIHT
jgi:hypothetical protein